MGSASPLQDPEHRTTTPSWECGQAQKPHSHISHHVYGAALLNGYEPTPGEAVLAICTLSHDEEKWKVEGSPWDAQTQGVKISATTPAWLGTFLVWV